jgi:hypothetical protein
MDSASPQSEQGLEILYEISKILDTGLDKKTLEILIALCENGVNPEVRCNPSSFSGTGGHCHRACHKHNNEAI